MLPAGGQAWPGSRHLYSIDDAHVHASCTGVVQEDGMEGPAQHATAVHMGSMFSHGAAMECSHQHLTTAAKEYTSHTHLRTASLPRKEKAMLDTPPLILHPGHTCLMRRVALMKSTA